MIYLIAGSYAGRWYSRYLYRIAGSNKESNSSHRISIVGAWLNWVSHFSMDT